MSNLIPYEDMRRMGAVMARSRLFGMKSEDEVLALMLVAQANGQHPAAAARDYDIIQGRPSKKAEAMLRDFIQAGGSVQWHRLDNEVAAATFSHPAGGSVRIDWDMPRARDAGLASKDMYKKWPRQMLRSRCISEGVRTIYPVATGGMYAPEEVQDMPAERDMGAAEVVEPAATAIEDGRRDALQNAFADCTTFEQLQEVWQGLSADEKRAMRDAKDEAKERIQMAEAEQ